MLGSRTWWKVSGTRESRPREHVWCPSEHCQSCKLRSTEYYNSPPPLSYPSCTKCHARRAEVCRVGKQYMVEGIRHSGEQTKGACLVPKRALSVMQAEVNRVLQLTSSSVIPIMYQVPRKVCNIV